MTSQYYNNVKLMTKFIVAKMSNPIKIKPNTTPEGKMSGQGDCSRALK